MRRAEKIRQASEVALQERVPDDREQGEREAARREWGRIRKDAREAFLAKSDWMGILNAYRDHEGFYTSGERAKMCAAYVDELTRNVFK